MPTSRSEYNSKRQVTPCKEAPTPKEFLYSLGLAMLWASELLSFFI